VIPERFAVIVVDPELKEEPVASPCDPEALPIVAIVVFEETQLTDVVRFCELLSEKVPVAENCWFVPIRILAERGAMLIETSVGGLIVSAAALELIPERLAVIFVVPSAIDEANPFEPAVLLMVAMFAFDEPQVTDEVMSCVDRSVNVPMAINCWVAPRGIP